MGCENIILYLPIWFTIVKKHLSFCLCGPVGYCTGELAGPVSPSENRTSRVVCGHTHTHHDINSKKRVIKVSKYKMNDLPWAQGFLSIISKHALHPISESKALRCKINNKTVSMLKKLSLGREADLSTDGCYICRVHSGSTGWGQGRVPACSRPGCHP